MKTLKEFQETLKKTIKGQDNAIERISITFYKYLLKLYGRDLGQYFTGATSLLLIGDSGSGKTYLVQKAAELLGLHFIELTATTFARDGGWHGETFLQKVSKKYSERPILSSREGAIIFIDEFDKICHPCITSGGDDFNREIQYDLLKYIEGLKTHEIDFNKCIFVFAGVFDDLKNKETKQIGFNQEINKDIKKVLDNDLIKIGLIPELCGRIQEKVILNKMTDDTFKEILMSDEFCINKWKEVLKKLDIQLDLDYDILIKETKNLQLGVRGLISIVETKISEIIQENLDKIDLEKFSPLYTNTLKR